MENAVLEQLGKISDAQLHKKLLLPRMHRQAVFQEIVLEFQKQFHIDPWQYTFNYVEEAASSGALMYISAFATEKQN